MEFQQRIVEELWKLVPIIQNSQSSAATHWLFIMLLDFLENKEDATMPNYHANLKKFIGVLMSTAKLYGDGFTETQKIFDTKYSDILVFLYPLFFFFVLFNIYLHHFSK